MNVRELQEFILTQMTAEEALIKLLEGHVLTYEKLKFEEGKEVHPLFIISMAAMDMDWQIAIPETKNEDDDVQGMVIGTEEYINKIFGDKK